MEGPQVVAWFNPEQPNNIINAAQFPHVLDKNRRGYVACIVAPELVHILTYQVKDSLTHQWSKCRRVFASFDGANKLADSLRESPAVFRNVSVVGSRLNA